MQRHKAGQSSQLGSGTRSVLTAYVVLSFFLFCMCENLEIVLRQSSLPISILTNPASQGPLLRDFVIISQQHYGVQPSC
eukprot:scaffold176328_cov17-Tisochrysis_lutea.AAC.1